MLLTNLQAVQEDFPLGAIDERTRDAIKGRGSALSRLRHLTRFNLGIHPGEPG